MAEKKKRDEQIPVRVPDEKPEAQVENPVAPVAPAPPAPAPAAKAVPAPKPPARSGFLGRAKPKPAPLSALASATGTSPLVLAALKAAYGWTERTRLTRGEFLRRRDDWLKKPASEV